LVYSPETVMYLANDKSTVVKHLNIVIDELLAMRNGHDQHIRR
jgi:hypothetical protein